MPFAVTPYYLSLIHPHDSTDPLRRVIFPDVREGVVRANEHADSLGEEAHQAAPGLIHTYPHKALLLITTACAAYCRFCTRARMVGRSCKPASLTGALAYLRRTPAINDVLISGGDPLHWSNTQLDDLLGRLRRIPHIDFLRIGTRMPVVLPQRITPDLVRMFRKHRPLWMSLHFVHPREATPEVARACRRLLEAGIPLMNQTVLLKGINDRADIIRALNERLIRMGVKPYYLHHGDMAAGTSHFRSTLWKGRDIVAALHGNTTGYAVPYFMVDQVGGGGKLPAGPVYFK